MQKRGLISELSNKTGYSQQQIRKFFDAFSASVGNSLSAEQRVTISGLGTFVVRNRKEKVIIDPNNPNRRLTLPERKVVKYLAGKTIKEDLRSKIKKSKPTIKSDSKNASLPVISPKIDPTVKPEKPILLKSKQNKKRFTFEPLQRKKYRLSEKNLSPNQISDTSKKEGKRSIADLVHEITSEVKKDNEPIVAKPVVEERAQTISAEQKPEILKPQKQSTLSPTGSHIVSKKDSQGLIKPLPPSVVTGESHHPGNPQSDSSTPQASQPQKNDNPQVPVSSSDDSYKPVTKSPVAATQVAESSNTAHQTQLKTPAQEKPIQASHSPLTPQKQETEVKAAPVQKIAPPIQQNPQNVSQPARPMPKIRKISTQFSDIQKKRKIVAKPNPIPDSYKDKKAQLPDGIKIPYIDLSKKELSKKLLAKVPEYIARLYQAVPVDMDEKSNKLIVAMVDPEDYQAREFIKKKTGYEIEPRLATSSDIEKALDMYSGIDSETQGAIAGTEFEGDIKKAQAEIAGEGPQEQKKEEVSSEAPTSRVVQSILKRAVSQKASDIHVEPQEDSVEVRFRIDGVLKKVLTLPKQIQASIISRIKILSGMKIDEQRLPQDGRFESKIHDRDIDFRVSTFPSVNGEKVVMRILDKSQGILSLDELGLTGTGFKRLDEGIHKSHGMTLVTGPTGSGKTTTLYAVLDRIMSPEINIVTLEDPVEYQIKGINQGQVRADIGFSFAKGLRSIVRQDPDVIMVGEIRDLETAEMAVQSALTGHIVLSTLHTNDASGAIPRLIDMGVEPFLIASSVETVVGQRLARKLCDQCRIPDKLAPEVLAEIKKEISIMPKKEREEMEAKELKFYKGKGCSACGDSGYKGRIGVFEVLPMTDKVAELAMKKSSSESLNKIAIAEGMITMKQDGIIKALAGKTTIEEVWRVTKE